MTAGNHIFVSALSFSSLSCPQFSLRVPAIGSWLGCILESHYWCSVFLIISLTFQHCDMQMFVSSHRVVGCSGLNINSLFRAYLIAVICLSICHGVLLIRSESYTPIHSPRLFFQVALSRTSRSIPLQRF